MKLTRIYCKNDRTSPEVQAELEALAASIKAVGLLNPLTLVATKRGGYDYEVAAGRRRFRALHDILKRTELTEGEYNITTAAPEVVAFSENHHRRQLTRSEEVAQLLQLRHTHTRAQMAEFLGHSEKYIAELLQLENLHSDYQRLIDKPNIPIASLVEVAKLEPNEQTRIVPLYYLESCSTAEIRDVIKRETNHYSIARRPWLDAAECAKCPHCSTTADLLLFGDFEKAVCFNPKCFVAKSREYLAAELEAVAATGKQFYLLEGPYNEPPSLQLPAIARSYQTLEPWQVVVLKGGEPNAIYVSGAKMGRRVRVELHASAQGTPKFPKKTATPEELAVSELDKLKQKLAQKKAEHRGKIARQILEMLAKFCEASDFNKRWQVATGSDFELMVWRGVEGWGVERYNLYYNVPAHLEKRELASVEAARLTFATAIGHRIAMMLKAQQRTPLKDLQIEPMERSFQALGLGAAYGSIAKLATAQVPQSKAVAKLEKELAELKKQIHKQKHPLAAALGVEDWEMEDEE